MKIALALSIALCLLPLYADDTEKAFISTGATIEYPADGSYATLLGFEVRYPQTLGGYARSSVALGVGLAVPVGRSAAESMGADLEAAVTDAAAFARLKRWKPFRQIGAYYASGDGSSVVVLGAMPSAMFDVVERNGQAALGFPENAGRFTAVSLPGVKAWWVEYPEALQSATMLVWELRGITYMIIPVTGGPVPRDAALALATEFISGGEAR